jgi:hypothetical protein
MRPNDHLDRPCPDGRYGQHCTHAHDGLSDWCCRDPYRGEPIPEPFVLPPGPVELEAVHVGLTAEQEIRLRALTEAREWLCSRLEWESWKSERDPEAVALWLATAAKVAAFIDGPTDAPGPELPDGVTA